MVLGLEIELWDVTPALNLQVLLVLFADRCIGMGHVGNIHHGYFEGLIFLLVFLLEGGDVLFKLLALCNQGSAHILLQLALHLGGVLIPLLPKAVQLLLKCGLLVVEFNNKFGICHHVPVFDIFLNLLKVFLDESDV